MKGVIYRIYDNTNGNIYYGSTIQSLSNRMAAHRTKYKMWLKGIHHYGKSFDILKNGDYDYNIVEEVECENKYELHNRERYYIENNECINKCIPTRTDKEYYKDNKVKIKVYRKEYCKKNINKILEKAKEYRKDNKDKIKEYKKQYNKDNKDKIKEYNKEKITCDCGCIITKNYLTKHKKTKKHNDLLNKTF
jgi:hypothetical protein